MSRLGRTNILATYGDQGVFPAGQPVFTSDGYLNPSPGMLFIWNPKTNLSLGPGITVGSNDRIVISVAKDRTTYKSVFGDQIYGCAISKATAQGPSCGTADVWDLYWDCLHCGDKVSVNVVVKDDQSFTEYPYNRGAGYTFTAKMPDCPCDSCEDEVDQFALACKLRDAINAQGLNNGIRPIFNKKNFNEDIPFTAHVLYGGSTAVANTPGTNPTTKVYCIDPSPVSNCEGCISVNGPAFTTATYDEDQTITFTYVTDPANPSTTLLAQLESVAAQITAALDGNGSAVVTKGAGICCPYRLEVNTCYTDFAITGYTPCENYNPFATLSEATDVCANCTTPPVGKQWAYGIRIISKPIDYTCACNPNLDGKSLLIRTLQVNAKSSGDGSFFVRQVSEAAAPENLGYQWAKREFQTDNGGDGRSHDPYVHLGYGSLGTGLLGRGRDNLSVVCTTSYCSYTINHSIPSKTTSFHGDPTSTDGSSIILIPSADTDTIAEFEAILNGYITSNGCPIKAAVTCGIEVEEEIQ